MSTRRQDDDPSSRARFRTDRIVNDNGNWYFMTREGRAEGPFASEADAMEHLELYVRVAKSGMLTRDLTLAPC